jgi:hypothetical protein
MVGVSESDLAPWLNDADKLESQLPVIGVLGLSRSMATDWCACASLWTKTAGNASRRSS